MIYAALIEVRTGRINKKEMIRGIKSWLEYTIKSRSFKATKEPWDLAIVAHVTEHRMKKQDVDNLAKIVLDALKKGKKNEFKSDIFLFEDDAQVVRLLVYKKPRKESNSADTDTLVISIRKHNPRKNMTLKPEMNVDWGEPRLRRSR